MKTIQTHSFCQLTDDEIQKIMKQTATLQKTFEAKELKYLQVEVFSGDITLIGHDEDSIVVEVFASERSIETLFLVEEPLAVLNSQGIHLSMKVTGETLFVGMKFNYLYPFNWFRYKKTSFKIFIPKHIQSVARTWGGEATLIGVSGNHRITTWGGTLSMQNSSGDLYGKTMGGKVEVTGCEGKVVAKTMGGSVYLTQNQADIQTDTTGGKIFIQKHKGQIYASTWGGNIEAADMYGNLECNTLGGNIYLKNNNGTIGASTKGGNIFAEVPYISQYSWFDTAGGNIEVTLPLDNALDLEVRASKIKHPVFLNFAGELTVNSIKGKLNGGGPNVTIKTGGGKVTIKNYIADTKENTESYNFTKPPETHTYYPPDENSGKKKRYNFSKPEEPTEKKTIASDAGNFWLIFFFCLLLGYGLNGITYFTLEFINPKSLISHIYKGIFINNIANSLSVVCALNIFINLLEKEIQYNWLKYFVLILITVFLLGICQIAVDFFYWNRVDISSFEQDRNNNGLVYAILPIIVSCAYFYYWQRTRSISRKISEQEYRLLNLEKLKSKAQLDALEARINPHFLYNSLNSIAGLIHEMPDKAEEMTIQLSKLFRYTTGRNEDNFHPVSEELEIIKSYLAIEQVRFGNRLQYQIDCEETIASHQIPRFLLQPLVENAIKHGISKVASEGKIRIEIRKNDTSILIKIHDNGPDFGEMLGGGFGLRSIREKLKLVYNDKATLDIQNFPEKAIIITLPLNEAL
jgi:sensor histidine kinase YesM